ncbi:cystathionine gamma-lyase [Pseudonocardiaceae bacterium YIM PH 21723]|nr:cystathionine gamma-lyase [Pseudonocardiaceae bacterium YIM PH 21723]
MTEPGTKCVHAGTPEPAPGQPFLPGPVFASSYHLAGGGAEYTYARNANPTTRALEAAIGALDGGHTLAFSSGMAAISTLLSTLTNAGDTVVLPSDGYFLTRSYVDEQLELDVRLMDTAGQVPDLSGVKLVLVESPANPSMNMCDIALVAERAHAAGALLAVDNTLATPLGQTPLDLGADVVVASDSKALTGHTDLMFGHLSTRNEELYRRLERARTVIGCIPSPFDAWLAHRSLSTLELRVQRQSSNAAAMVEELLRHPAVQEVRWPGHPADPSYELATRQLRHFGGVITARFADAETADAVIGACTVISAATSFGGVHSIADRRAQWGDPVDPGLVRFSAGCEDPRDLVADLRAALT